MTNDLGPRGRDAHGRWIQGQTGNTAGRPRRDIERKYLDAMMTKVSIEDWAGITAKAVAQSLNGDAKAREWLARYLLGDPIHIHEYLFAKQEDVTIRVVFEGGGRPQLPPGEVEAEYEVLDVSDEVEDVDA